MTEKVRNPLFAGSFYPAKKEALGEMIDNFFLQAKVKNFSGNLKALIVPHAGYIYSGATAAFSYKVLSEAKPKRIVLFGPSHSAFFEGALGFEGEWITPFGKTTVSNPELKVFENDSEHSLEVQLPFMQRVLKEFEFVPIIYGEINSEKLAKVIEKFLVKGTVFVASSDLSHYLSYDKAKQIDSNTINSILALNLKDFLNSGDACGKIGIGTLLILARKNKWKTILLDYRNSGDTAGDKKSVVGYAAIAFVEN